MNAISNLNRRISKPIPVFGLILVSSLYLFAYLYIDPKISFALIGLTVIVPVSIIILIFPDIGFLLSFIYSAFFFFIDKHLVPIIGEIPQGVVLDLLLLLILFSYFLNRSHRHFKISIQNPVIIILILFFCYFIILIGNPSGSIVGSILGIRLILRFLVATIIMIFFFRTNTNFLLFIKIWYILALLAMLYGMYHKYFGIPSFELKVAMADEEFYGLNFIDGRWRIWSFLNDSTSFGLFMSTSAVFFIIYSLKKIHEFKRILLITTSSLMILASTFSGTRTAIAIIVIGILFFSLFEIANIKITAALMLGGGFLLIIIFGPISNPTIKRVRSTFFPKEDPSYIMRESKMERFRPYIYNHPFGGGLNTTNSKGHDLSGFGPDSFYLKSFLEFGIIGTLLFFVLFTAVISIGIKIIDANRNNKYPILALISSFFMLTIAGYTQISIYQFPYFFIFWGTVAYVAKFNR